MRDAAGPGRIRSLMRAGSGGTLRTSYAAEEQVLDTSRKRLALVACLAGLATVAVWGNAYVLLIGCQIGMMLIAVAGVNILVGQAGLMSLGHGAFLAIGAYGMVILHRLLEQAALPAGLVSPVALVLAVAISVLAGAVVGLPSLRVKGLYLAVATLAANFIVIFIIERPGLSPWTGGVDGIDTPRANLLGWQLDTRREIFALIACLAVLALMAAQNLTQSRVGRAFLAIRERDFSAEILGISLMRTKLAAFAISAGYCGLAGALFALFYARILPEQFELQLSLIMVAAVIVGGIGRTLGVVFGVIVIVMVPEAIKVGFGAFGDGGADLAAWRAPLQEIAFGALILAFILYEPHGLARIADRALRAVDRWPFARD